MNPWYAGPKCTVLINYALISVAVTIILGYSMLTVDYSHAQKISPSNSSSIDNISNSSNNNNTPQKVKDEVGKDVQKNQQPAILEQQQSQSQALPSVKITSHTQNQEVPTGTMMINGISSDTSSNTCSVYIILNNVKPYQKVIPLSKENGQSGSNDFSTWKYTFTPQYATIKEGNNKMTSKISCDAQTTGVSSTNSNLTKFNSLNVTGVTTNSGNSSSNSNSTQAIKPLSNTNSTDSAAFQSFTYNTSQNAIYSPLTPAPTTANPLSTNDVENEVEDNEIQSSNVEDEEIGIDEKSEDDDDTSNERSRAREVFEHVEETLRDSGIDFDISSMLN
jgi:hypothetical protein